MTVVGTAGSPQGMDLVKGNGAHFVFNHREKGYLEEAAEAVGGDGFDVIIENASDINLGSDLTVIGPGARVVVIYFSQPILDILEFSFLFRFYFVLLFLKDCGQQRQRGNQSTFLNDRGSFHCRMRTVQIISRRVA